MNRSLFVASVGITLLLALSLANLAYADSGSRSYDYLAGTGFLCGLASLACPDIAMASNGDTITLTGSGSFTIHPDSVSGSGTFIHTSSGGGVLATGTWTATKLLSFDSFTSPSVVGGAEGGKALIAVNLFVGGTLVHTGVLTVICGLGSPPPGQLEGIHLNVQDAINFNKQVSGFTVFIRTA